MKIQCEISLGELVDKISILQIKKQKINDQNKLSHIEKELGALEKTLGQLNLEGIESYKDRIRLVNEELWNIEDDIRIKEKDKDFGEDFVKLARSVYITNDKRFAIKNEINNNYGSQFVEVKSYEDYQ